MLTNRNVILTQASLHQLRHTSQLHIDPETITLIEQNATNTQGNGADASENPNENTLF